VCGLCIPYLSFSGDKISLGGPSTNLAPLLVADGVVVYVLENGENSDNGEVVGGSGGGGGVEQSVTPRLNTTPTLRKRSRARQEEQEDQDIIVVSSQPEQSTLEVNDDDVEVVDLHPAKKPSSLSSGKRRATIACKSMEEEAENRFLVDPDDLRCQICQGND